MRKFLCIYSLITVLFLGQVMSQTDTVFVSGTVSTTTSASVNKVPYTIEYFDITDSSLLVYSDSTDAFGAYSHSYIDGTVRRIEVTIQACTLTTNTLQKSVSLPFWTTSISRVINFTNFCFEASFIYYDSSNTVRFTSFVNGGVPPLKYYWDFDDGSPIDSTPITVSHFYPFSTPIYNVVLNVVDANKDTASFTAPVDLNNCYATFGHQEIGNGIVFFTDSSVTPNTHTSTWTFGDGTTGSGGNVTHQYLAPGFYIACLTITDTAACIKTTCDTFQVTSFFCSASFNIISQEPLFGFENTSVLPSPPGKNSYSWNFGDGSAISHEESPVHIYEANGSYTMFMTLNDSVTGCKDTMAQVVNVTAFTAGQVIIAGTVFYNGTLASAGMELIYKQGTGPFAVQDSMSTLNGEYAFRVADRGTYHVRASLPVSHPDYFAVAPVYYRNSYFWNGSTGIVMSGVSSFNNDIELLNAGTLSGSGWISGQVRYESGAGAAAVNILVLDGAKNFVARDITDASGNYAFTGLNLVNYEVYADLAGKNAGVNYVQLHSAHTNAQHVDFTIYEDFIQNITESKEQPVIGIYPNPVTDLLNIVFADQTEPDLVSIRLTDIAGRSRKISHPIVNPSSNSMQVDLRDLESGMYYLCIKTASGTQTFTCIKMN